MATVEDILDQVDGLRRDAADRVAKRFATVNALASATTEQLTEISGIGKVMADRIHAVAAGAKGGAAAASSTTSSTSSETPSRAAGTGRGRVGKVVESATGTAMGVVGKAAPTAKKLADRATEPARKVVEKVTKRGR